MPRRRRDDEVAERAGEVLDQQRERRREAAQRGAQTRRQREDGAQPQEEAGSSTQADVGRDGRAPKHEGMVTVAIRGPIAAKLRELAERHGMSLAKLVVDAVLVYDAEVRRGYVPGTRLAGDVAGPAQA